MPTHRRLFATLLLLALFPGLGEAVENFGHLLEEGHLAHLQEHRADAEHESGPGPEHGCNGTFHVCPCHVSLSFVTPLGPKVGPAVPRLTHLLSGPFGMATAGFHMILERPPCLGS